MQEDLDQLLDEEYGGNTMPIRRSAPATEGFPVMRDVPSSKEGIVYQVIIFDALGSGSCGCKGFSYRRSCRHLDAVRKELGFRSSSSDL